MRPPPRTLTLSCKPEGTRERDTMSSAADESNRSELHPEVRIGHVHLRVADLDRATAFYRDVLGFDVTVNRSDYAFLSAGGYHHHIGLNTRYSQGGTPPPEGHTGLLHFAILYPDRRELACDRPRKEWFDSRGNPNIKAEPFDPRELLVESGLTT